MKAAIFKGKGAIELDERPDPTIKESTDAVVRVVDERRAIKSLVKVGTI